ncbi:MAG: LysR family transcriptional regulator [Pseudomonas sp.]|uniref:LysR family transcriptional regulator n=1 Tax=Pseudomonas sp. TaxID=306 RepID=UPI0033951339
MKGLKLNQLQMLLAVADAGGFSAAAAELGCTQSRISHAIAELEAALRTRLLVRSRTGCVPTDAGHRVIDSAREILRLTQGLVETAQASTALGGQVRIACFRSVSTHILPPALAALAREYPNIRIDIDDGFEDRDGITQAIEAGRAELGIAQLPIAEGWVAHALAADDYVLVAPTAWGLAMPVSWSQLGERPYIQLDCAGARLLLEQCQAAGFAPRLSRTLKTDSSIAALVQQGLGYSILPRLALFPIPAGVTVLDLPIPAKRHFALVARPEVARREAVRTVVRFIRDQRLGSCNAAFRAGLFSW